MTDNHLDTLAKILAKAERTNHIEERKMLFARAQTLSTRHGIDLAIARAHTAKAEKREEVEEQTIRIGRPGQVGLAKYTSLFLAICRANDIKCLISRDSSTVYAHGFPSDIDVAQMLYGAILPEMVAESDAYLASGEYKAEKVWVDGRYKWVKCDEDDIYGEEVYSRGNYIYRKQVWVDGEYKPVHGKAARQNFYSGFIAEIERRLMTSKREAEAAAVAETAVEAPVQASESANLPISTALVLQEKKAEVDTFHQNTIKRLGIRGSWKGGSRGSSQTSYAARSAGRAAGARTSLTSRKSIGA